MNNLQNPNVITKNQNKEYKWVEINENNNTISDRFYIAPNPDNMHEMVKKLVETFISQDISVRFKYQLTTNMEQCDRIIIYSDANNKDKVEKALETVYQDNASLFCGCERSVAWLYDTNVPDVYTVPETPGDAYSGRLSSAILDAKASFDFLYGITDEHPQLTLKGKAAEQAIDYMKLLMTSTMLRKGLLLAKDGRCITIKDKNVKTIYNSKTGILKNINTDKHGNYSEVEFSPTKVGREGLLENFYSVSTILPREGLVVKKLTPMQRKDEMDQIFYQGKYSFEHANELQGRKK